MKKTGIIAAVTGLILVFLSASSVFASGSFDTTDYEVRADVAEDASVAMNERISVNVYTPMHGIYRYIPLSNEMTFRDDSGEVIKTEKIPMKVSDVSCGNDPFVYEKDGGNSVIRIGDEYDYVSGEKTYDISYTVQLYDDGVDEYDVLYYNFIPHDWETGIKNAAVEVNMPKAFDAGKVKVYCGQSGSKELSDKASCRIDGKTIYVAGKDLDQGEGITVMVKLPNGYFKGMPDTNGIRNAAIICALLMALLALLLWFLFGRDRKLVKTVEFEAPEGITPAEMGYIVDGKVDKVDVISLIFYFADRGYLTIEEPEKGSFILHRERDLPEDVKAYERTFFNGLFSQGSGESVALDNIDESFYETYKESTELIAYCYTSDEEKRIFPKSAITSRAAAVAASIIGFLGAGLYERGISSDLFDLLKYLVPFALLMGAAALGVRATDRKYSATKGNLAVSNVLSIVLLVLAAGAVGLLAEGTVLSAALTVMCFCVYFAVRFMMRRTKYGTDITGRILGFRNFIETAEVEKLRALVEENPSYFFNILPYAYVMGLSKKWARKFETIPTREPYWYHGYGTGSMVFNTWMFYGAFSRCASFAGNSIKVPANTSAGSIGGGDFGGFSGGGFGGGGGGGW